MRTSLIACAAALTLSLAATALAQAPASVDLDSLQPMAGTWSYRPLAAGSEAAFVDASAVRRMIIRCDRPSRSVSIVRTGVASAAASLSVWASSAARSLPASFQASGELVGVVRASDPLLDAIAFSRGRFATAAPGVALAIVPLWPEPVRVIEDCRN